MSQEMTDWTKRRTPRQIPSLDQKAIDRFFSKITKNLKTKCHEWTGGKRSGYGLFTINRKSYPAHRVAYHLAFSACPPELYVCHTCDNPKCVNPKHLFLGTAKDNVLDCVKKGRHHFAKLTHCKYGHALSGDNVIESKYKGWNKRECRICKTKRVNKILKDPKRAKLYRDGFRSQVRELVHGFLDEGLTLSEIMKVTGYSYAIVRRAAYKYKGVGCGL